MGFEQFAKFGSGISGITGAGMSLVGGIGSAIQGRKNRKLARELQQQQLLWQQQENERAFKRNVEMWNMQNAYNSPSAQMKRLVEAGLNPNLAYGSLGSSAAESAPQYNAANVPTVSDAAFNNPYESIQQGGDSLMNASMTMSNLQLQKAQVKNLESQTRGTDLDNLMKDIQLSSLPTRVKLELTKLGNEADLSHGAIRLQKIEIATAEQLQQQAAKTVKILGETLREKKATADMAEYNATVQRAFSELDYATKLDEYNIQHETAKHIVTIVKNQIRAADDAHELSIQQLDEAVLNNEYIRDTLEGRKEATNAESIVRKDKSIHETAKLAGEYNKLKYKADKEFDRYHKKSKILDVLNFANYVIDEAGQAIVGATIGKFIKK